MNGYAKLAWFVVGVGLTFAGVGKAAEEASPLLQQRAEVKWTAVPRQVLAFYYDWYGNPTVTGHWEHWEKVDEGGKRT